MKNEGFNNKQLKISKAIYEGPIKDAFKAHAGESDPDPAAVLEVQKASIYFLQRILEKSIQRSVEKQEEIFKLNIEDVLYQFRNQQKYLDLCAKKIITYSLINQINRKKSYYNENQDKDEMQEEKENEEEAKQFATKKFALQYTNI